MSGHHYVRIVYSEGRTITELFTTQVKKRWRTGGLPALWAWYPTLYVYAIAFLVRNNHQPIDDRHSINLIGILSSLLRVCCISNLSLITIEGTLHQLNWRPILPTTRVLHLAPFFDNF
ncbi:hypothetical protein DFS34DRAFT_637891 [Phlyctochytrium arcticum]|nr:hypothetical protein DFS34DRAFT_637891 [Phlyctochytrium arcticum]